MEKYIKVGNILVENRIFLLKFKCDYEVCKGSCCWFDDGNDYLGGPLNETEVKVISENIRVISEQCSSKLRKEVLTNPFEKYLGVTYTAIKNATCVFCNLDKGSCALKLAHDKVPPIDIPDSCYLAPLVFRNNRLTFVEYESGICESALEKGERENVDFLKAPIIRIFGEDFWLQLDAIKRDLLHS